MTSDKLPRNIVRITSYISMRWWWWRLFCTRPTHIELDFYSVSSL